MVHAEPRCENGSIGLHVEGPNQSSPQNAVVLSTLSYAYSGHQPIISDISLTLPKGSRCLLLGANGAGEPLCLCATSHPAAMSCIEVHGGEALRALPAHALPHILRRVSNTLGQPLPPAERLRHKCTCLHVLCACTSCLPGHTGFIELHFNCPFGQRSPIS